MKRILYTAGMITGLLLSSCTSDFNEINQDPNGFLPEEVSAKYFLTEPLFKLFGPDRFPYWRAHLIHADRYAGHFTFGHHGSWWSDGLSYAYNAGYTDASWGWLEGAFGGIDNFLKLTNEGGQFENEYMYAIGLVTKSLFYQMYTDTFGMIPFSEAGVDGIVTPKFDSQAEIYKGAIADLDLAMQIIGDTERTGVGIDDVAENDVYCQGDLQKWKRLANTLKLRMALRANGAAGDDFSANAINQALAAPLLDDASGSVLMPKDTEITQWSSAAYGDIWHNFGGLGSKWTIGKVLIDYLRDNNDPRLAVYAKPAAGGDVTFTRPAEGEAATNFEARVNYIISLLDDAGADYSATGVGTDEVTISLASGQYIGQPSRLNGQTAPYANYNLFSTPSDMVIQPKMSGNMYPEIVMTSAEAYFLRAEAAVKGLGSDDAQLMMEKGIVEAMKVWGIGEGDAQTYIASAPLADITAGTVEEKLEKIAVQRWIANYTDGFEAWAVVRDTGYPAELAQGVSDLVLFEPGTLNGAYPQRMRYGTNVQTSNGSNYQTAVSAQGPDTQATKLWWAN
ncbi:SusD/RagB family nutrient-binding outer membrane lipoprotein [Robertkochia marina]|uniref:SusD/RagB family nutrient-binding outer membrane lipoprotein n=1 Tax=Robertkochia marina TaxID=1227945 RepID=A0A4S3M478_9FLAO|nr:SusD/RagB family nutrient-binding outer membrane lipoprotein [Robertkochia marina]THD68967.1 SusD/RagB family nutrient-binding outer membrane lipoprotein [Robertkochia marina]TRZ44786.1 SusD/RagB family nutrient-binding outer membrane lipoprotein [Robertkochia marina]